jgi:preprotein translocase subunit SecE
MELGSLRPFLVSDICRTPSGAGNSRETKPMKKEKVKTRGQGKETGSSGGRGQVVRLKSAKAKPPLSAKLPPVAKWWQTAVAFVAEAWQELKKVTWPNRKETLGTTIVVIILVVIISGYLGLVDMGLSALLKRVMRG